jgi:hypothetical protein
VSPTRTGTPTLTPTSTATLPPHSTPLSLWFQNEVWPEPSYLGVADTYVDEYSPTKSHGQAYELKIYYTGRQRMLLHFDLAGYIPRGATVTEATLELYAYNRGLSGVGTAIGVYEILEPWTEAGATWNDAAPGEPWQLPGCEGTSDRSQDYAAVTTFRYTNQWQTWEDERLTQLVQRWVSSPSTNHGVILVPLPGSPRQWWTLHSSQSVRDREQRPRLFVTFEVPPPTPTSTGTPTSTVTPALTPTRTPTGVATLTPTGQAPHRAFLPVILRVEGGAVMAPTGPVSGRGRSGWTGATVQRRAVSAVRGVMR